MATLTNDEFAVVLLDIVADFHDGVTTKAEAVTALQAELPKFAKGGASVATAAQLSAAAVTSLNTYLREAVDWYAGTVDGGPSEDGYYPLTDSAGNEYLLPSPAKLISDLAGVTPKGTVAAVEDLPASGNEPGDFYVVEAGSEDPNHAYGWTGAAWVDLGEYQGPKGDKGDTGAGILSGSGAPSAGTGADGDTYLDVDTGDTYGPKAEGAWGSASGNIKGLKGDKGDTGAAILLGSGAPSSGVGADEDIYLDVDTGDIYGPKTEGAWGSAVANIKGPKGDKGWSPRLAIATDGARRVHQVVDWVGGEGTKPATGQYVGAAGLVATIGDAVDVRGPEGDKGDPGEKAWSPQFAIASDGSRRVLQVSGWTGGEGDAPATGQYVGADGYKVDIADAIDVRGLPGSGFVPMGDWVAPTSYDTGDAVSHNGASFASLVDNNTGIEPGVTSGWESSWMVVADPAAAIGISDIDGLAAALADRYTKSEVDALLAHKLDASAGPYTYAGTWNASTNTPAIPAASSSNKGRLYRVSVAGSTDIDGETDWKVGDELASNGATWDKRDNTEPDVTAAIAAATGTDEGDIPVLGAGGKLDPARVANGLPAGGSAGQIPVKASPADYDTDWIDPPSGGGGMSGAHGVGDGTLVSGEALTVDASAGLAIRALPETIDAGDLFIVRSLGGFTSLALGGRTVDGYDQGGDPMVPPNTTAWVQAVSSTELVEMFNESQFSAYGFVTVSAVVSARDLTEARADYIAVPATVSAVVSARDLAEARADYIAVPATVSAVASARDLAEARADYIAVPATVSAVASARDLTEARADYIAEPGSVSAVASVTVSDARADYIAEPGLISAVASVRDLVALDSDSSAFFAEMTAAPDSLLQAQIDRLIQDLKSGQIHGSNIWAKTDYCLPIKFPNATDGLRNLVAPATLATAVNSPAFLSNRYYKGDGSSMRIDTYNPTTGPGNWTLNSACLALGVRTPGTIVDRRYLDARSSFGDRVAIGRGGAGDGLLVRGPNTSATMIGTTAVEDADGLVAINRSGASARQFFLNGVQEVSDSEAANSLLNATLSIFSENNGGSFGNYSDFEADFFWAGAGLTANEQVDLHDAYARWAAAREAV